MSLEGEFECYSALACIEETLREIEGLMAGDLSVAVRTVSTGIDALKKLTELAVKTQNIELQEGILELRGQLLEIKEALLAVKEENLQLREENKMLKEKLEKVEQGSQENLKIGKHGYFKQDGDGPFCMGCYDSKGKLHRVIQPYAEFGEIGIHKCSVCDKNC